MLVIALGIQYEGMLNEEGRSGRSKGLGEMREGL